MGRKVGSAIDIGTTTIAAYLVDLDTGEKIASAGAMNAQAEFGADVTGRITYCAENGHDKLTQLIRRQLDEMITMLLAGAGGKRCSAVTIAANTVMAHLAAGYSPVSMGTAPFKTASLFGQTLPAWETLPAAQGTGVYYAPAVSAYVGGDITAGLLAAGFEQIGDTALFIDIGTNGEIVLKHKGTYYCCAAAAGPAFEGAEITLGMAAVDGAVSHVWDSGSGTEFSVIGDAKPKGFCGSGLLDLLAVLLRCGIVDETGRMNAAGIQGGPSDRYALPGTDGRIYITAADVRKLQLAKAAIAGGIQVLLHYAGITETDISLLALAGGFGSFLNPESAARIGLFPKALLPAAKAYGNTAGEGAVMALLSDDARSMLEQIRRRCEYIELSSNAFFNDKFVEQMAF